MRFYQGQHRFYCGIDLHARSMHVCVIDHAGDIVFDRNLAARPEALLRALEPFRDGLVIGVECMFAWYWVADWCVTQDIAFVLGHALYLKAIHGGKAKNDRIDATKLARLLRGGNFPTAYAYPKGMRETRDLLRRRTYLVHKRAELFTHLHILNAQYNRTPFPKKLCYAANRAAMKIAEGFGDASVQKNACGEPGRHRSARRGDRRLGEVPDTHGPDRQRADLRAAAEHSGCRQTVGVDPAVRDA